MSPAAIVCIWPSCMPVPLITVGARLGIYDGSPGLQLGRAAGHDDDIIEMSVNLGPAARSSHGELEGMAAVIAERCTAASLSLRLLDEQL